MPPVLPVILFMALVLIVSLQGLAASGHFPREHRPPALAAGIGSAVLFGSIALAVAALVAGIAAVPGRMPWYAAVIGGGLSVLGAPLVLQQFPDRLINGRGFLLAFAVAGAACALALFLVR